MAKLNPNAEPFVPTNARLHVPMNTRLQHTPESADVDERSLFMTFSNSAPLRSSEISQHFIRLFGQYSVELVYVHNRRNRDPKFGKLVFTKKDFVTMVLGNEQVVKLLVNGKPLWLKKYIPKTQRDNQI